VVSEEQQRAIDVRRQWVARHLVRGLTLAGPGGAPGGAPVPACRNPDTGKATGKAWSA